MALNHAPFSRWTALNRLALRYAAREFRVNSSHIPKQKFEVLTGIYALLGSEFRRLGIPKLVAIADSWEKALSQMQQLRATKAQVKTSVLVAGLEQGLRETSLILSSLPEAERHLALKIFRHVVFLHAPSFLEKEREKIQRIVARGKIKNETEWHLIRHRVDEIEGELPETPELLQLYTLLDAYESAA